MVADISELMVQDVALVPPGASVQDAARAMAESGCRIVVIGQKGAIEGVLTEHDILIRVVVAGLDPAETRVEEVMSADLFTCREDQSVEAAAAEMAEHRVNQLPVLDLAGHFIGVLPHNAARPAVCGERAGNQEDIDKAAAGAEPLA